MSVAVKEKTDKDHFRDAISTVDKEGKRVWIYPKKPKGKFTSIRTMLSWFFFAFFFTAPFIKINEQPLLLFNILERKFILFGMVFWPQDFHLFVIATITFVVFIVVFTMIYGRVFCGFVCPQPIFMEMLFRKIEYFIEGDYQYQMSLDKSPWNFNKIFKKASKHFLFIIVSFLISNTFLTYIIGIEEWFRIINEPVKDHISGFISIFAFTGAFYFVFSRFREQVCTTVCPYGRLQGVLLDKNSVVVAYDYKRGEPRGKWRKNEDRPSAGKGDCIDCMQCVYVCPNGIDIRNGTQLECINCTACIDACNDIMDKTNLKRGLIRFDSENGIAEGKKFKITRRIVLYTTVLILLMGALTILLATRSDTEATILRSPGMLYQEAGPEKVSNLYTIKLVNKSNKEYDVQLKLMDINGEIKLTGNGIHLNKFSTGTGSFLVFIPKSEIQKAKTSIKIGIYHNDELLNVEKTNFVGPIK